MLYIVENMTDVKGLDCNALTPWWIVYGGGRYEIVEDLGRNVIGLKTYILDVRVGVSPDPTKLIIVENSLNWEGLENFIGEDSLDSLRFLDSDSPEYFKREIARDYASICVEGRVWCGCKHEEIVETVGSIMGESHLHNPVVYCSHCTKDTMYLEGNTVYLGYHRDYIIIDAENSSCENVEAVDLLISKYPKSKIVFSV